MNFDPMYADYGAPQASSGDGAIRRVPWQIVLVAAVLALEGLGNLFSIPSTPLAAFWLAAKCLFIVGLVRRWKAVFALYLLVATWHVFAFGWRSPLVALMNLITILLVVSSSRYFFRPSTAV